MSRVFMRSTAGRTVHLKVQPRPRNLADSKLVLDIVRQFGEVETFKHLKYEPSSPAPNSFIAIFKEERSAVQAVDTNLIEFEYRTHAPSNDPAVEEDGSSGRQPQYATMAIRASGLNHESYIARQPYFAGFEYRHNALSEDMNRRMPSGFWAMAYMDYKLGEPESRARRKWRSIFESRKEALGERGFMGIYERAQLAKNRATAAKGDTPSSAD